MEYGILVAEEYAGPELVGYQIISSVDSVTEARAHIAGYIEHGPDSGCLPPDRFVILRRDQNGFYTVRETIK